MRVTLINPPQILPRAWKQPEVFQPTGLAYLASSLEFYGKHKVTILDANAEGLKLYTADDLFYSGLRPKEIIHKTLQTKPEIIGISVPFSLSEDIVLALAKMFYQEEPKLPIVLGGAHPTTCPGRMLISPFVDYLMLGEAEHSLVRFLRFLESSAYWLKDTPPTDGIAYHRDGEIIIKPKVKFIENLDKLPLPARHLLDMPTYFKAAQMGRATYRTKATRWASVTTSRGCPYRCIFCVIHSIHGYQFRARSPQNVCFELLRLKERYGITHINFMDDNILHDRWRFQKLCDLLIYNNLDMQWACINGVRADRINREIAQKMAKAGCVRAQISPESGSQEILSSIIRKGLDLTAVPRAIQFLKEAGITVGSSFVIGLPGETKDDIWQTLKYGWKLYKLGSHIWFNIAVPFHGTRLYDVANENDFLTEDFDNMLSTWKGTITTPEWTAQDIEEFQEIGHWQIVPTKQKLIKLAILLYRRNYKMVGKRLYWTWLGLRHS